MGHVSRLSWKRVAYPKVTVPLASMFYSRQGWGLAHPKSIGQVWLSNSGITSAKFTGRRQRDQKNTINLFRDGVNAHEGAGRYRHHERRDEAEPATTAPHPRPFVSLHHHPESGRISLACNAARRG